MSVIESLLRCLAFVWGTVNLVAFHINAIGSFGWTPRQDTQRAKILKEGITTLSPDKRAWDADQPHSATQNLGC